MTEKSSNAFKGKHRSKPLFLGATICLLMLSVNNFSTAKPVQTEKYWEKTLYLYSIGSYFEAEVEAMQILSQKRNRKSIDRNYINLLLLQTRAVQKQFRFKDAKRLASKADAYIKILTKASMKLDGNLMLCDYFLEEGNILAADLNFTAHIPDTLVDRPISSRVHADSKLVKGSILTQMGYSKAAIPLLQEAIDYFKNHLTGVPEKERYFDREDLNELAIKEKYAQSNYMLAISFLKLGKLKDAEFTLLGLLAWTNSNFTNEHFFRYRPYQVLGLVFEQENEFDKAMNAFTKAYTENPHIDNEYEKQTTLLNLIIKCNEYGRRLEARNYLRKLEIKANMNLGQRESSQYAYELSLCHLQFLEQSYKSALYHVAHLEKIFSFVSESHPYSKILFNIKKDIYYYQGNYALYRDVVQKIVKSKARYLGEECPEYYRYQMEAALAEIYFGKDLLKAKRVYKKSYHKSLKNEIEFSSTENARYLTGLADLFYLNSAYDSSLVMQEKAVEANKELHGETSIPYITSLSKLSEIQLLNGNYKAALESLGTAEKLAESKKGLNVLNLEMQIQLARINRLNGDFGRSNNHLLTMKRQLNSIHLLPFGVRKLAEAEQAQLYFDEGVFYKAGKLSAANRQETEAISGNSVPWLLSVYETEAKVNIVTGNFANSTQAVQKALALSKDSSFERSKVLLVQADYLIAISDYAEALEIAKTADEIRKIKLGVNHFYRFETIAKIAQIRSLMPSVSVLEVENLYKAAIDIISASLGSQNIFYVKTEQKLAELYLQNGREAEALAFLLKELDFWQNSSSGSNYSIASTKALIGTAYYLLNDFENASSFYSDAAKSFRFIFNDKHPDYLRTQSKLARVYYMTNESAKAANIMQEIVSSAIDYSKKYFSSLSFRQRNRYWNSFKDEFEFFTFLLVEKSGENNAAKIDNLFNIVISTKGMLLSSDIKLRKKIINGKDTVLTRIFNNWLAQKELLTYAASLNEAEQKEQSISSKNIEKEIERLEKEIGQRTDIFKTEGRKNSITIKQVAESLDPNEYAIEIVRYRTFNKKFTDSVKYAAIIVAKNTPTQLVVLPNGTFLEKKLLRYYRNSIIFKEEDEISYENYWQPIKEKLKDSTTIYLSSEGVYNQINIETLKNKEGKFAIDHNQFVFLTNTKDVVFHNENKNHANSKASYVVCGNPRFYSNTFSGIANIPALEGAEIEANLIDQILQKNKKKSFKVNSHDIKEEFVKRMNNPKVFHIATHGYFNEDDKDNTNEDRNPLLNSGLLLSNSGDILGEAGNTYINKREGILTAYEALDLNFDQTELVVLSACETGRGEIQAGEGVYGLQRSFLIAGSKAVILSLFKVNDEVTQMLMTEFYQKWLAIGDARVAFMYAKRKIKESYPQPIYWGAFVMIESDPKRNPSHFAPMSRGVHQ